MDSVVHGVSMKGRTVLISGASSGIGRAMAACFADAGGDLCLVDVDKEGLEKAVQELRDRFSITVTGHMVDLRNKGEITAFWESLTQVPDTLINNAGIYPMKAFLEVDDEFLAMTFDVNIKAAFWMCQDFIGRRLGKGGCIINVSSIEAILPFKRNMAHYSMSKAAVIALTRALARDYGRHGFRANVILPGAIHTPGTRKLIQRAICSVDVHLMKTGYDFSSRLALGRWGKPDEVAGVALFLASELASYVHGAVIPVDGGFLSS
jgi:NAD(P)-dependent dehydrogenase (short-subunit alcohol dehydrogenase family)